MRGGRRSRPGWIIVSQPGTWTVPHFKGVAWQRRVPLRPKVEKGARQGVGIGPTKGCLGLVRFGYNTHDEYQRHLGHLAVEQAKA